MALLIKKAAKLSLIAECNQREFCSCKDNQRKLRTEQNTAQGLNVHFGCVCGQVYGHTAERLDSG